jgi:potassium-transporting ATPase potassium-binding subunit
MKLAMLAVLVYPLCVLGFSAASVMLKTALDGLNNAGPHGLSEILYAFASTTDNNGSAFAGLSGNTLWYNTTLGLAMAFGRFAYVIPVLAIAGALAQKKRAPASIGAFPTHGPLFVGLLIGVIVILYLLQYFPALALGPIVEHFLLQAGKLF